METSPLPVKGCKIRPMLGNQGLWAGRDLYRTTPTGTRGLGFSGLIRRTVPLCRLLQHEGLWRIYSSPDPHGVSAFCTNAFHWLEHWKWKTIDASNKVVLQCMDQCYRMGTKSKSSNVLSVANKVYTIYLNISLFFLLCTCRPMKTIYWSQPSCGRCSVFCGIWKCVVLMELVAPSTHLSASHPPYENLLFLIVRVVSGSSVPKWLLYISISGYVRVCESYHSRATELLSLQDRRNTILRRIQPF
jgi:hypothetical protein